MRLPSALLFAGAVCAASQYHQQHQQQPIMASTTTTTSSSALLLSDTLSSQRALSIFASLARDDMNTSAALGDTARYTVVLAPTNAALQRMAHKPWEDPVEVAAVAAAATSGDNNAEEEASRKTYTGADGADRAERNLRRFVQACLVGFESADEGREWKEGERRRRGVVGRQGGEGAAAGEAPAVWWETKDGKVLVMPQRIPVDGVVSRVVNGEVWAIDGTFAV